MFKNLNIATAKIRGLNSSPYYFESKCYWAWEIQWEDCSSCFLSSLPFLKMGDTEDEAQLFCNTVKRNFHSAGIYEGSKIVILFSNNGTVIAIGRVGQDIWIDINDKFRKKTFKELNIKVSTLKVF